MAFTLGSDGSTMDTVLTCDVCGVEELYEYGGCEVQDHVDNPVDCVCYPQFVTWAKAQAKSYHECDFSRV
jgi:hypothetical protein